MGSFLPRQVRSSDVSCRYGGEEFILILPEASLETTLLRARHICEEVRQLHVQYKGLTLETVTLSLGVAIFPSHGSTRDAILKAADNALYRAKRNGRNRVVVAD
jgi:diguanylate cyclase (GGDEF)-like protein